jgi:allantoinase
MKEFGIKSQNAILSASEKNFHPVLLHIKDGHVDRVLPFDEKVSIPVVDLKKSILMPGIVDTHAHINEPGRTEWEGFETATLAAAAGGITTVVDMPLNCIPATTTVKSLQTKKNAAEGKCKIHTEFWGGVVPGNVKELSPMIQQGARGFKAFLIDSGVPEFPLATRDDLFKAMKVLARENIPLLVHAELQSKVEESAQDSTHYQTYLRSRPEKWEVDAIEMMVELMRETGCAVHIVHLSAASALPVIRRAKEEGLPLTVETCPHYLTFSAEEIPNKATYFKCAPPIRESTNREKLWQGLLEGDIDMIVSDHSPCTPQLKQLQTGDFSKAWGGISGLQFSLPAIWTEMKRREISLPHLVQWMCAAPAKLARLDRGTLNPGAWADMIVWDPDRSHVFTESEVRHRHHVTPYLGRPLFGKVEKTFVEGNVVFEEGRK